MSAKPVWREGRDRDRLFTQPPSWEHALQRNSPEMVDEMIRRGNGVNYQGQWPLRQAAALGYIPIVEKLLAAGADIHMMDDQPLRMAALFGRDAMVDYLLDNGASLTAKMSGGYGALQMAAEKGRASTVALLIRRGADVRADDNKALHSAVKYRHHDVIRVLLDAGADPNAMEGKIMMTAADTFGSSSILKLLLRGGGVIDRHVLLAVMRHADYDAFTFLTRYIVHREKTPDAFRQYFMSEFPEPKWRLFTNIVSKVYEELRGGDVDDDDLKNLSVTTDSIPMCLNTQDGITLDSIHDIPLHRLVRIASVSDTGAVVYHCFDVVALYEWIRLQQRAGHRAENPMTRGALDAKNVKIIERKAIIAMEIDS